MCLKKKSKLLSQFGAEILGVQSWNPQSICQITVWQLVVKIQQRKGQNILSIAFHIKTQTCWKSGFTQFAENNGSQQNIASFVVTTFMKVALSSGQEQRVEDWKMMLCHQFSRLFPCYYQKDIKLRRSPRKRQYVAHERKKFTISKILLTVWSSKNWLVMLNSICLNRTLMELANICLKIK